jgi:putative ABC transport system substrate-binding protein
MGEIAREVAASKPDVIVTSAVASTVAAQQATSTIPIVMMHAGNPVAAGLIETLARPGGNVTGTMNLTYGGKHVDLMRELLPRVTTLAVLVNPTNANAPLIVTGATEAASKSGIRVVVTEVTRVEDFPSAYAAIRTTQPDGLIVAMEPLLATHNDELIAFAAATRLPAIYDAGEMARRGGLMAYATMFSEHYRMAADYVDKILKGARPADLPVQQPQRFELVINLKTAKALGLTIPKDLLLRADEVIQ